MPLSIILLFFYLFIFSLETVVHIPFLTGAHIDNSLNDWDPPVSPNQALKRGFPVHVKAPCQPQSQVGFRFAEPAA